jgi:hypothetical protein
VRSVRLLMEKINYSILFRSFLDLGQGKVPENKTEPLRIRPPEPLAPMS